VKWDAKTQTLSGKSAVVGEDPYPLTIHVPSGSHLKSAIRGGEKAETTTRPETATVRFVPTETGTTAWIVAFKR